MQTGKAQGGLDLGVGGEGFARWIYFCASWRHDLIHDLNISIVRKFLYFLSSINVGEF